MQGAYNLFVSCSVGISVTNNQTALNLKHVQHSVSESVCLCCPIQCSVQADYDGRFLCSDEY